MCKLLDFVMFWLPRVGSIIFIVSFITPLALDVFDEKYHFFDAMTHLLPALVLIAACALAWKRKLSGALLFFAYGFWYLVEVGNRVGWLDYLFEVGIPIMLGGLFLLDMKARSNT